MNSLGLPDRVILSSRVPWRWLQIILYSGRVHPDIVLQFEIPPVAGYGQGRWRHLYDGNRKLITYAECTHALLDGLRNHIFKAVYHIDAYTLQSTASGKWYKPAPGDFTSQAQEIITLPASKMHDPHPLGSRSRDSSTSSTSRSIQRVPLPPPAAPIRPALGPPPANTKDRLPFRDLNLDWKPLRGDLVEKVLHFLCPGTSIGKRSAEWRPLYDLKFKKITHAALQQGLQGILNKSGRHVEYNSNHYCGILNVDLDACVTGFNGRRYLPTPLLGNAAR